MSKDTIREHYVSVFFLDRFADRDGHLWVYDSKRDNDYRNISDNESVIHDIYETKWANPTDKSGEYILHINIENMLRDYEFIFAPFLRRLDQRIIPDQNNNAIICDKEEKELLRRFVTNLIFRNPKFLMRFVDDNIDNTMDNEDVINICKLLDLYKMGDGKSLVKAAMKKALLSEDEDNGLIKVFTKKIEHIPFMFMYNPKEMFILSDSPVKIGVDNTIISDDKMSIFLPLSKSYAVMFGHYENAQNNRLVYVDDDIVKELVNKYITYSLRDKNKLYFKSETE